MPKLNNFDNSSRLKPSKKRLTISSFCTSEIFLGTNFFHLIYFITYFGDLVIL